MATLTESRPDHIGPIDPDQEPDFQRLTFTIPRMTDIAWDDVVLSFDRASDILLVFVTDRYQPAVVVYDDADGDVSWLVNPDTMGFVGWQFESFLGTTIRKYPDLIHLLDHAELMGITANELHEERQRALGYYGRSRAWLDRELASLRSPRPARKEKVLRELLASGRPPLAPGSSRGSGERT